LFLDDENKGVLTVAAFAIARTADACNSVYELQTSLIVTGFSTCVRANVHFGREYLGMFSQRGASYWCG